MDDRCGDLVHVPSAVRDITVREILEHRTGLAGPSGLAAAVMPQPERAALLTSLTIDAPGAVRYSELSSWVLLEAMLENAVGASLAEQVKAAASPNRLHYSQRLDPMDRNQIRVNHWVDVDSSARTPVLWELSEQMALDPNPGVGGYGTALALVGAFSGFAPLAQHHRQKREVSATAPGWRWGLRTDIMKTLRLPDPGGRYVGHFGFKGSSVLVIDLWHRRTVLVHLNTLGKSVSRSRRILGAGVASALGGESKS